MNTIAPPTRMNRRNFLKQIAVMTAGLLLPSQLQTWAASKNRQRSIGILLPPSDAYPTMGESFVGGMRLYFNQVTVESVELHVENITHSAASAAQKARTLIEDNEVDVLTGILSDYTAQRLRNMVETANIQLIVSGIGANVESAKVHSDCVIHNLLDYWRSSYAMGIWAAEHIGKRGVLAASLYESGYDAYNAFRLGFEATGGNILHTQTTHVLGNAANNFATFFETVKATSPDFVYATYAGKEAFDFVTAYANAGLSARIPLIGSSFLTDETVLPALGEAALGIKTALPWSAALDTPENVFFTTAYAQNTGQQPNAFAMLGYEAARLISESEAKGSSLTGQACYLREVRKSAGGFQNVPIATLSQFDTDDERFAALQSSLKTGWLNAYLSV